MAAETQRTQRKLWMKKSKEETKTDTENTEKALDKEEERRNKDGRRDAENAEKALDEEE